MGDDLFYSTVVIKQQHQPAERREEDQSIYSEVKSKGQDPAPPEPKAEAVKHSHTRLWRVCFMTLCFLLVGSIITIICISVEMSKQKTDKEQLIVEKKNLENQTEQLIVEKKNLENQTEQLMMKTKNLENQTEQLMMKNKNLENQTEQLMMKNKNLENQTEQLIVEKKNLENQTEQLIVEKKNLENQTEQLMMKTKNLENQTEQLIVEKKNLENQTEQLMMEKKNLENQTEQLMMKTQNLENQTEQLIMEKKNLENQTEQLSRNRDDLNRTLMFILTFNSFPVSNFCPNKKCQPCQTGWIQFKEKCYLFQNTYWKNWNQSRLDCQNRSSDLVVVNDLQEQQFISSNSQYYYDQWHGYMLGLRQVNNKWIWVDGHEDTLGFWIPGDYGVSGPGVQLIPSQTNVTANWDQIADVFQARFICEQDVLIRST